MLKTKPAGIGLAQIYAWKSSFCRPSFFGQRRTFKYTTTFFKEESKHNIPRNAENQPLDDNNLEHKLDFIVKNKQWQENSKKILEATTKIKDNTLNMSKDFREKTLQRSKELYDFRDKTLQKSKDLKESTIQKSKDLRESTIKKTKDLRDQTLVKSKDIQYNIKKIIPKDIHENIYTVPNILTFTRLLAAPVIGYLILHGQVTLSLILFTYSCVTDFLDGFIARRWNLKSVVGSVIDPLADKMLMMICTICLSITSEIPFYVGALIIGRDVGLGLAAVVIRYMSLPPPKTFWRYWDFSIPSAEVHPTMISKINTALQMLYLGSVIIKPVFMIYLSETFGVEPTNFFLAYVQYLEYTVAVTTLWSGLSYVFSKKAVKFIKQ